MSQEDRAKQQGRLKTLHNLRQDRGIQLVLAVLVFKVEALKDRLSECLSVDLQHYQGEIRALNRLIKEITVGQADIEPKEKPNGPKQQ